MRPFGASGSLPPVQRPKAKRKLKSGGQLPPLWRDLRGALALLGMLPIIAYGGFHDPVISQTATQIILAAIILAYGTLLVLDARRVKLRSPDAYAQWHRINRPERLAVIVGALLCWSWVGLAAVCGFLVVAYILRGYLRLVQTSLPPGLVFVGSFIILTIVGTLALRLPAATPPDQPITTLDASFTIVSAISQTGLVVRPTGDGFTRFGQIIILVWMQVGALGVIVFGALLASLLGSTFGLRATQTIAEGTEQGWAGQLSTQKLVTFIIVLTHAVELVGALFIYFTWPDTFLGKPADMVTSFDKAYHSIFLSVSAFCNGGFTTTDASLVGLRNHWMPHTIVVPLIVIGSIGFPVLENIWQVLKARLRKVYTNEHGLIRLSLNTKLILATAAAVYAIGFAGIFIGELFQTNEALTDVALDAHFMNINRTSGFNTVEVVEMGMLSRLVLIFLMFVGGSPGSVAGGVKLIVVAVLALTVWSTLRGRDETIAFGRTIPDPIVRKCAALIVLCLSVVLLTTGVLALSESRHNYPLGFILFEATSAFGTTGLSLGITDSLSPIGKGAIMFAMFVGRVGVLAVFASLLVLTARNRARYSYPTEGVVVY